MGENIQSLSIMYMRSIKFPTSKKVTGERGVSEKGEVIYEQKYGGIGTQFRVFMPIITK